MRRWATVAVALLVFVVLGTGFAVVAGPPQVRAYLSHWKGSPTQTDAYGRFPITATPNALLVVAGDVGDSGRRLTATADAIDQLAARHGYDALLLLGDNVYPNGDPDRLDEMVFEPFAATLERGTELLAILGNHDIKDGNGPAQLDALGMPGRWWSTRIGDVLLVGLDSNTPDDPEQLAWLETTLQNSTAPWRIVALHHPPYSAGYQGSSEEARAAFSPLFARYGVQLVLSGHDHDYQRSRPVDGVTYVVTGAAAGTRRTGEASFTARSFSWHSFVELAVFDDALVLRAVNQDVRVADEAVIPR